MGLKVHMQLLSNDEGVNGFSWQPEELAAIRAEMDAMLAAYPDTVISCCYYHEVITTGMMIDRQFGWSECPSVTQPLDKRSPQPKRLTNFIRWASDLSTMHRCCTSETRDCRTCKDGAAHMSWVMVNKRAHMRSTKDLQNWIEVYEMFAKLYQYIRFGDPVGQRPGRPERCGAPDPFSPDTRLSGPHRRPGAVEKSGLVITPDIAPRIAVTYSSAVGGLDTVLKADRMLMGQGKYPLPCVNPNACINMVGGKISMMTGATGPILSTITACATGLHHERGFCPTRKYAR